MSKDWIALALLIAAAVLVGAVLSVWVRRRIGGPHKAPDDQHPQRWHLDAGLRILSGDQPGLSRRWLHGRAALEPGRITLRPFRWGLRIFPMAPVEVDIAAVVADTVQRSGWRSAWSVTPGARLLEVTTAAGATLQLATVPTATDQVLHVLAGHPG